MTARFERMQRSPYRLHVHRDADGEIALSHYGISMSDDARAGEEGDPMRRRISQLLMAALHYEAHGLHSLSDLHAPGHFADRWASSLDINKANNAATGRKFPVWQEALWKGSFQGASWKGPFARGDASAPSGLRKLGEGADPAPLRGPPSSA